MHYLGKRLCKAEKILIERQIWTIITLGVVVKEVLSQIFKLSVFMKQLWSIYFGAQVSIMTFHKYLLP